MTEVVKIEDWSEIIKPYVGMPILHYKDAASDSAPAPATVTKILPNKKVAGIRFIHGGAYYEPFNGAAHMKNLIGPDGKTPMTAIQKQNSGGWDYTPDTILLHKMVREFTKTQEIVIELAQRVNELIARSK